MKRQPGQLKSKLIDFLKSLCFLSPSFLGVCVFFIVPFGVVVYYSLIDGVATHNFVGLQNFKNLISNPIFITAAKNTLKFSVTAVPLAVILAIVLVRVFHMGLLAVWIAMFIDWALRLVVYTVRLRGDKWIHKAAIED